MPKPRKNEKENDFISRCIPEVIDDGTTKDNEQAYAICKSIWTRHKRAKEMLGIKDE